MTVNKVVYSKKFIKQFKNLPVFLQRRVMKAEAQFKNNPLHPGLRLHQLHGRLQGSWSITVTMGYRIIFDRTENSDIFFMSIGRHDIYEK